MTAEEFLTSFRARGFRILMKDGLRVEPFPKLTTADRAAIAEAAADEGARNHPGAAVARTSRELGRTC